MAETRNTDHIAVQNLCRVLTLQQQIRDSEQMIDDHNRMIASAREELERAQSRLAVNIREMLPEVATALLAERKR